MKLPRFLVTLLLLVGCGLEAKPVRVHANTVLDGRGGVLRDQTVVVDNGRIVAIEAGHSPAADYELGAKTLMPGWIDTHIHLISHFNADGRADSSKETPAEYALRIQGTAWATLMGGFTTVQSIGADTDKTVRDLINGGVIPGPRVLTSLTPITERSGSPEEIREKVRKLAEAGADVIKIFSTKSSREGGAQSMTDAQIQAACTEAAKFGKRVAVHAHADGGAKAAILAGCNSIEHGTLLTNETLDLMAARGTFFDPNLSNIPNYLEHRAAYEGIGNFTPEGFAEMEKSFPVRLDTIHRAMAKKVKIVFGTDAVAGLHGHNAEEFVLRVQKAGQPAADAIISATSRAAESLGLADKIGSLRAGFEADLVATDGNPLDDITSVRRVAFVMRGGIVYKSAPPP